MTIHVDSDATFETDLDSEHLINQAGLNISAFRILFLLKALCHQQTIALATLNQNLLDSPLVARTFTNETIRKYLYTLARLDYEISTTSRGDQTRYTLTSSPIKHRVTMAELHALHQVFEWLHQQPIKHKYQQLLGIAQQLVPFFKADNGYSKAWLRSDLFTGEKSSTGFDSDVLEKYCFDGQALQVTYLPKPLWGEKGLEKRTMHMAPEQLRYQPNGIYFIGCDLETQRKVAIETRCITAIQQLPKRVNVQAIQTLVMFKLTGRVARNYKLHPNESVLDNGDHLLVKHKTDEPHLLLKRLMRYGSFCQVLTPESIRLDMQTLIKTQLSTLDSYPSIADKQLVDTLLQGKLAPVPN